jgi:hypothetical protein
MSRRRLRATLVTAASTVTLLSGCAAKPVGPELADALPKAHIISVPPSTVIKAALEEVAEGQAVGFEGIAQRLEGIPPSLVGGEPVATVAQTSTLNCRNNMRFVPSRLWAALCGTGGFYTRLDVSAGSGTHRGDDPGLHAIAPEERTRFSYHVDELRRDAGSLSLPLQDISGMHRNEWPGHLPFVNDVLSYERPGRLLLIVELELIVTGLSVKSLTIYSKK